MNYKLISVTTFTAGYQKKCAWCPEPIAAGENYKAETSSIGGWFQALDWHPECWGAARTFTATAGKDAAFELGTFKRGTTELHQ